jgi:hypothetical protein
MRDSEGSVELCIIATWNTFVPDEINADWDLWQRTSLRVSSSTENQSITRLVGGGLMTPS